MTSRYASAALLLLAAVPDPAWGRFTFPGSSLRRRVQSSCSNNSGVLCTDDPDCKLCSETGEACSNNGGCAGGSNKCVQGTCQGGTGGGGPCDPNPCKNGGTCTATGPNESCDCSGTGFIGPTCEEDDPCEPDPCSGNGTCESDGSCTCNEGWEGTDCGTQSPTTTAPPSGGCGSDPATTITVGTGKPKVDRVTGHYYDFTGSGPDIDNLSQNQVVDFKLTLDQGNHPFRLCANGYDASGSEVVCTNTINDELTNAVTQDLIAENDCVRISVPSNLWYVCTVPGHGMVYQLVQ